MPMSAPVPETVTTTRGRGAGVKRHRPCWPLEFWTCRSLVLEAAIPIESLSSSLEFLGVTEKDKNQVSELGAEALLVDVRDKLLFEQEYAPSNCSLRFICAFLKGMLGSLLHVWIESSIPPY